MKIGILTIHFGRNCGSALQAYALNRYLTKQGHEVRTIDYIPERFSFRNKYRVGKNRNAAVSLIASVLKFPKNFLQYTAFDGFLRKYVPMTRRITDAAEMQKYAGDFEALIVGSDQVWNPEYNGESQRDYYLEFEEGMSVRRIAYAASIGLDKLPEEIGRDMARALSGFSAVSVRE